MSTPAVCVDEFAGVKEIATVLAQRGFNCVPVTSRVSGLIGVITEDDLIMRLDQAVLRQPHFWSDPHRKERERARGKLAREIMSPNPVTISPEGTAAVAAELMHEHHLKSLPVVDEEGVLMGILTRRDLLKRLTRPDAELAEEVRRRFRAECVDLWRISIQVEHGIVTLMGWVGRSGEAARLRRFAEAVDGVVAVRLWVNAEERLRPLTDRDAL